MLQEGRRNLHLGCGLINHPDYINVDIFPAPHVHYVRKIDNLKPFADNTIDLVYASHCLEHFSYRKTGHVLEEWFRVLKPRGILRVSVPDFDLLVEIYKSFGNDINRILPPLMGGQNSRFDFHYSVFNYEALAKNLYSVGFSEVRRWEAKSIETGMDDWASTPYVIDGRAFPVSINVEAKK